MLSWIAVVMIGGFLAGCGVIIGASCLQIIRSIRRTPSEPKPVMQVLKA